MLQTLGLDPIAEQVYRVMLKHPQHGVLQLADQLGIVEPDVRAALDRLSALALIRSSEYSPSGFAPLGPEAAMNLLLARQQERLALSQAAAAQLIADCASVQPQTSAESESLSGIEVIRARLCQLSAEVTSEVMTFAPGGAHPEADLRASREPNEQLLDRGVRMRTIYLDSVRNDAATQEHVAWLSRRGGQVRTTTSLPVRMIIMDRRIAVLPVNTTDAHAGAVVLHGAGTVTALCALFESTWAQAAPLGSVPVYDAQGRSQQEKEVVQMLAEGMTDESIAKRLGVSPRTARRIAADLMERLDARSRFEAGVHAVQDGWLPSTR
ncbi:helix-turn-helix domain-containing protein [Streptomyces bambusae]|uniref:Helix-turn-helix transcriptional regulator n=1 Tax=Streptomyces bambusae TaxID=1550616 RepID=A0ABS6ZBW8_9ACTN|nr:helix-turn-helix transcriptional regulator [Streptomyces bambusae]MBW5485264.1 helix-turn-helix transcriptional regulator [Streptomyces bambusae]